MGLGKEKARKKALLKKKNAKKRKNNAQIVHAYRAQAELEAAAGVDDEDSGVAGEAESAKPLSGSRYCSSSFVLYFSSIWSMTALACANRRFFVSLLQRLSPHGWLDMMLLRRVAQRCGERCPQAVVLQAVVHTQAVADEHAVSSGWARVFIERCLLRTNDGRQTAAQARLS